MGCNALKNCCKASVFPCDEKTIFVEPRAPEQNCVGPCVATGVGVAFFVPFVLVTGLHWNAVFCERCGACERVSEL